MDPVVLTEIEAWTERVHRCVDVTIPAWDDCKGAGSRWIWLSGSLYRVLRWGYLVTANGLLEWHRGLCSHDKPVEIEHLSLTGERSMLVSITVPSDSCRIDLMTETVTYESAVVEYEYDDDDWDMIAPRAKKKVVTTTLDFGGNEVATLEPQPEPKRCYVHGDMKIVYETELGLVGVKTTHDARPTDTDMLYLTTVQYLYLPRGENQSPVPLGAPIQELNYDAKAVGSMPYTDMTQPFCFFFTADSTSKLRFYGPAALATMQ